jgi:predicted GNAT superfamily acetyltransferase
VTTLRELTTIEECREVVALERAIWAYSDAEDVVPSPLMIVTLRRGGILIGAFDDRGTMVGFVYSVPSLKHGRPAQWSHMLGVLPEARAAGLGVKLKLAQRQRTLEMGLDLIEWTYDPLQALNAHLNVRRLGAWVEEYEENLYGESSSVLHRGTPTDRFVAQWAISSPCVERRIAEAGRNRGAVAAPEAAPVVNATVRDGAWLRCARFDGSAEGDRLLVEVPLGFSDMLAQAPDLAREWRFATRQIFQTCFARGYRATDFLLDRAAGRGHYVLSLASADSGLGWP